MISMVQRASKRVKLPTPYKIVNYYLDKEVEKSGTCISFIKHQNSCGVILMDGSWSVPERINIIFLHAGCVHLTLPKPYSGGSLVH